MRTLVPLILLLTVACATTPPAATTSSATTPTASAPGITAPAPSSASDAYTLVGMMSFINHCGGDVPSEIDFSATLANAEHSTKYHKRLGLMGRSYLMVTQWKTSWGAPTEWRDITMTRFDGQALCTGSCNAEGRSCSNTSITGVVPVQGTTTKKDIEIACNCG